MTTDQVLKALDEIDSVYISVNLVKGGPPVLLRWRDKSLAIRRKIRAQVNAIGKQDPKARFNARLSDNVDHIIIIGEAS